MLSKLYIHAIHIVLNIIFWPQYSIPGGMKTLHCAVQECANNQAGTNLTTPSQKCHVVRRHCTAESKRRVAEIKSWFLCHRPTIVIYETLIRPTVTLNTVSSFHRHSLISQSNAELKSKVLSCWRNASSDGRAPLIVGDSPFHALAAAAGKANELYFPMNGS